MVAVVRTDDIIDKLSGSFKGSSSANICCIPPLQAEAKDKLVTDDVRGGEMDAAATVEEVREIFTVEVLEAANVADVFRKLVLVVASKGVEVIDSLNESSIRLLSFIAVVVGGMSMVCVSLPNIKRKRFFCGVNEFTTVLDGGGGGGVVSLASIILFSI